jgi:hypothetical protein
MHGYGRDIVVDAQQEDCPSVFATCWNGQTDHLYEQVVNTFQARLSWSPYFVMPLQTYCIVTTRQMEDEVLDALVNYFGIGGIFDYMAFALDSCHQRKLLSLENWHGEPCVVIDSRGFFEITNLYSNIRRNSWPLTNKMQLFVIAAAHQPSHEFETEANVQNSLYRHFHLANGIVTILRGHFRDAAHIWYSSHENARSLMESK